MWEKRATSAECKNYSNSRVLGYGQLGGCSKTMCKFYKVLSVENKMKWRLFYATIPRVWYEVAGKISNHEGV